MNWQTLTRPHKPSSAVFIPPLTMQQAPQQPHRLQRSCACGQHTPGGGECTGCKKKRLGLQRQAVSQDGPHTAPLIVHDVLHSPGQPLDAATRAYMEPRFGHDFSRVRVHTDARAAESAQAVRALAYTVGRDLVFGAGQYTPNSSAGRKLVAHELAHVIQQQGSAGALQVGPDNDPFEREAEQAAERALGGATAGRLSRPAAVSLQRKPDVGFNVRNLTRQRGLLDDPDQSLVPGAVSWPLSFAVTSPLEAEADVEVTGASGDNCTGSEIGFLQTVHTNWLHIYYWGQSAGDGSIIVKTTAPNPSRDGDPGSMWYEPANNASPSACGDTVNTHRGQARHRVCHHAGGFQRGRSAATALLLLELSNVDRLHPELCQPECRLAVQLECEPGEFRRRAYGRIQFRATVYHRYPSL
jgi:Domain of unknown function (DUF4157)